MKPLSFILAASCLLAGFSAEAEEPKLNVLMISIDDLNDWTGFLGGHPDVQTPHMDGLAKRGRNFTNAHCTVPVCTCSRISVMSGLAATTHGSYEIGPPYQGIPALKGVPSIHASATCARETPRCAATFRTASTIARSDASVVR